MPSQEGVPVLLFEQNQAGWLQQWQLIMLKKMKLVFVVSHGKANEIDQGDCLFEDVERCQRGIGQG